VTASISFCINIDGKSSEWGNFRTFHRCPARPLEKDRAGFDMRSIKMCLGRHYLYIYIDGRSVTGLMPDRGGGMKKTSIRISFDSSQAPLNRVRIAADPRMPWQVKLSYPSVPSRIYGSQNNKYWSFIRQRNMSGFEVKIPVFLSRKGVHVGVAGGPIIRQFNSTGVPRSRLSDVLINSVDIKTHRLVDTVLFSIRRGDL
jgi:hypothetical protein